ncbi:MAG TPA: T9SS type A sorting domain-containing protein [Ignavibacteria bacterium]|nr:T9SS type A sorting domain-containing protein [Ignavibacteria bacterium]
MKLKILLFLFFSQVFISAQVVTAVAPLKPGNKWLYLSSVVYQYSFLKFEVLDSVKVINNIPFFAVLAGENLGYTTYMGITPGNFYAEFLDAMNDSLYKYFKTNPNKGDTWEQQWIFDPPILYSTIIDTFSTQVFGQNTLVYVVDRTDSSVVGSREYWTKEYGLIVGRYEQAEDILIGCVIDGVLYGDTTVVGIEDVDKLPNDFTLYQNYPNPFNPSTVISWQLASASFVTLKIYDVLGREIITLVNRYYVSGKYKANFNANGLPSSVYFYTITAGSFHQTKKMVLLR